MKVREGFKHISYKKTWASIFILIVFALVCFVYLVGEKQEYIYEISRSFDENSIAGEYVVCEGIELPVGVYTVQLSYLTDTNVRNFCTVQDGTVFYGALKSNGEHLYQGLTHTKFDMWLWEGTEALQVVLTYGGIGNLDVGRITITNTNQIWSMLLVWIGILLIGLVISIVIREKKLWLSLEHEQKNVVFGLVIIILLASIAYLNGGIYNGADLIYHLQRIEGVKDGLLSGQFPVRLEPEWLHGHGYANGIFYCNVLLMLPAVLRILGFTVTASYNVYCIFLNIATALIAYYCFAKIFKNRYIGLICSGLYTLSIFRIYRLVIIAAVGEGSAMTFMPLVLYGLYRIFTQDTEDKGYHSAWIPIAVGYAGLLQTHVLSCEITALVTICICLIKIRQVFCPKTFLELAKGALGAILLSLWYLVPFLDYYISEDIHIKYLSARTIQDRGLYPAQLVSHFWKLGNNAMQMGIGMKNSDALSVGLILVLAFLLFGILWVSGSFRGKKDSILTWGKLSFGLGGLMMLMSQTFFPWNWIQSWNVVTASLVSSLQFPNRFLGWGTVFLVMLFGCCLWYLRKWQEKLAYYLGVIMALIGITTSSMFLMDYVTRDQEQYVLYNEEGMGFGYISGAEYLLEGTDQNQLYYNEPTLSENVELLEYEKGALSAKLLCINESALEGFVDLPLLFYKGYRAYGEDKEVLQLAYGDNNVVRVIIPEGYRGEINVCFQPPFYWRVSEIFSYISWGVMITLGIAYLRTFHYREKEQEITTESWTLQDGLQAANRRKQIVFWMLLLGILLACLPYCVDYISVCGEGADYLWKIEQQDRSAWILLPAQIFRSLGMPLMNAYKVQVLLTTIATAVMAYLGVKSCLRNSYLALLGSLIYTLLPWRIKAVYINMDVEVYSLYLLAAVLFWIVCVVLRRIGILKFKGIKEIKGEAKVVYLIVLILIVFGAVYQTTDIVNKMDAVWLYTGEQLLPYL